jgi:hypothetical protein
VTEKATEVPKDDDLATAVSIEDELASGKIKIGRLIDLAKVGHKEVLPALRQLLDLHPEIWQKCGKMAFRAQIQWLHIMCKQDLFHVECMKRNAAEMEANLAGPESSPLEQLQVERIVALKLQLGYYEGLLAKYEALPAEKLVLYLHEQCTSTDRRLQQAIMNLARIRKLLPRVLKIDVVVSGEVQTTIKESTDTLRSTSPEVPVRIRAPENRIKDLLAAALNN